MSAMVEMSRAIRLTIEQHAPTLQGLDDETLRDYALIVSAFAADLRDELANRVVDRALDTRDLPEVATEKGSS